MTQGNQEITIEDILCDPKKFGMPTWQEFARNPDKYRHTTNKVFDTIFKSLPVGRSALVGQEYHVTTLDGKVYETKSLEECERILSNEGFTIMDCKWAPHVIELPGKKFKMIVEITPHVKSGIILGK